MARLERNDHEILGRDAARARRFRAALELLRGLEVQPAPEASADDIALVRSLGPIFAQTIRATRHTSGAVRAYASLIQDGYDSTTNASGWAARIAGAAGELDEYASRIAALRVCDQERVTQLRWQDVLGRVAERCRRVGICTIEVIDRTNGPFHQKAELAGRSLFHILRNAVEATPRGGIVRVRADQIRIEGAAAVHVRVSDAGRGIDTELEPNSSGNHLSPASPTTPGWGSRTLPRARPRSGWSTACAVTHRGRRFTPSFSKKEN
jgi:signal transduction histidine kinase